MLGQMLVDWYRIESKLGEGGMGVSDRPQAALRPGSQPAWNIRSFASRYRFRSGSIG
jgi:hypothetical protein